MAGDPGVGTREARVAGKPLVDVGNPLLEVGGTGGFGPSPRPPIPPRDSIWGEK